MRARTTCVFIEQYQESTYTGTRTQYFNLHLEIESLNLRSILIIFWRFHVVCLTENYQYRFQIERDDLFLAIETEILEHNSL